jgi:hypothetical protein
MHGSFPFDDNMMVPGADPDSIPDNGWAVQVNNQGDVGLGFAAYAVCASAAYVDDQYVVVGASGTTRQETASGTRILVVPGT